jgi:S-adenosylmethionine:tRNA ribosyltransferase-isomerase
MRTSDFDFKLPISSIAQVPVEPRDSSRLMVVDKDRQTTEGRIFQDIIQYLSEGDVLVWNNSKVFKARLHGEVILNDSADGVEEKDQPTGEVVGRPQVEVFLVRPMENVHVWKVLAKPGKKLRLGTKVRFAPDFEGEVMLKEADGTILMQFAYDDLVVRAKANEYGEVPTPPYVDGSGVEDVLHRYQTVYAKHEGSVAAPTAGFHFTPELIELLKAKGVQFAEVTLHVGLGTFLPVKADMLSEHVMHSEWVELTDKNAEIINLAKAEGRRVVAVGTTTVRSLEGVAARVMGGSKKSDEHKDKLSPFSGDINIFITPGFTFQIVDALITNFHLPKSTLLMLVSAFVGDREFTLKCYEQAIQEGYRFYSFGDAMLIK